MASSVSPISSSNPVVAASNSSASAAALGSTAPTEGMFLQLLVAQIKNQDPLNPTDSVQFVTQLAQFSELEQVTAIRSDIEASSAAGTGTTGSGTNGTGTNGTTGS